MVYSYVEFQRYGLGADYAYYAQAWSQMAHGHLATKFLRNQGEASFLLLAPLSWLWPHGPILLWVQDMAVVGAEIVAFLWICEIVGAVGQVRARHTPSRAGRDGPGYLPQVLAGAGLVALLADPWIWWTLADDFHSETVAVLFAVLFARELQRGRRRAWLWAAMTLLSGAVATSYVLAIGLGALIGSRRRLWGAIAIASGAAWIAALHGFGFTSASGDARLVSSLSGHTTSAAETGSLSGLLRLSFGLLLRPGRLLSVIWSKRLDLIANLASAGFLGVLAPTVVFVLVVVILEDSLYPGLVFSEPSFQSIPIYIFGPVGVVIFLVWLARRHGWLAIGLAAAVMIETIGWGVVWLPRTPAQWMKVPEAAAAKLNQFSKALPNGAEVVASQGISGRFAVGHPYVAITEVGRAIPLDGRSVWFVVAPGVGIETASPASENALVAALAGRLRARPVAIGDGIYSYVYRPPSSKTRLRLPGMPRALPAWLFHSTSGVVVTSGAPSRWRVVGTGRAGYLVYGDYWSEPSGPATATARLSGRGVVLVEVWDATTNSLLAQQRLSLVGGEVEASVPFTAPSPHPAAAVFRGFGPFAVDPLPPASGDQLEVRIYSFRSSSKPVALSVGVSTTR
jgi:hypothetical protein